MGRAYIRPGANGGTWYIEYYYEYTQHKEKVGRIKDGTTERDAKRALKSREGAIVQGKFDIAQKKAYPLFVDLMDKYLEYSETHKKSHTRDLASYKHLQPFFGSMRINEINAFSLQRYKMKRMKEIKALKKNKGKIDRDISFVSINRELALLRHFFTLAIKEWGTIDKNPVLGIKMFPEKERERYLTETEIPSLLEACDKSRNTMLKTIVLTALNTGGRLREILYLKVRDIDFHNSMIYFEHTKNGDRGKVPMTELIKEILKEHLRDHMHEYVFCNKYGKPFNRITTAFNNAVKVAGITDFRFHDLRHTFASHLAMNGIEGRTLQELGRWKTPKMAMRYSHLSSAHKKKAIDTLGNIFSNKYNTSTNLVLGSFGANQQDV